jgi:hypothetical protein
MSDISLSAKVTRTDLGLGDLDINASPYRVAGPSVMEGTTAWERNQVNAPWVEGDITISRRRGNVTSQLAIYVSGTTIGDMMTNVRTLVDAFNQDRYTLQINMGTAVNQWDCEAADYAVVMDTAHVYNMYALVTFSLQRKPVPLAGAF